jgi:tetratricopeptide (TPR) repeat protein
LEYRKERVARQRAQAAEKAKGLEAAKATAISGLLQEMLSSANPDLQGPDFTVRQLLDQYSAGLTNQLAGQPEVEATLRQVMGWAYYRLGVLSKAESNLLSALELQRMARIAPSTNSLRTQQYLARLFHSQRKWDEAEKLSYETWQGYAQLLGATNPYTLGSKATYAGALSEGGQLREAEALYLEVLQDMEKVLGPDDFGTICALVSLGQTFSLQGSQREAERCLAESLSRFKRTGCEDRQDALNCAKELALLRLLQGRPADAEKVMTNILPRAIHKLTSEHYLTLQLQRVLARAYADQGRLDKAAALCNEALEVQRRTKADQDGQGAARTQLILGRVLVEQGKLDEAEPHLQDALIFFRSDAAQKPKPELAAQSANWLGAIQLARNDYAQAATNLLSGWEPFFARTAEMSPNERRLAVGHIISLYQALGNPEQIAVWQKKLESLPAMTRNR